MKALDELVAQRPAEETRELRVDVSAFFGEAEGETVFVYRDPDLKRLFAAARDAEAYRKRNPQWPEEMAQIVAVMAIAHVEPASREKPVGLVYQDLANNHKSLFTHLMTRFSETFGHLVDPQAAAAEKKGPGRPAKTPTAS